jgi:hypothetical protein
MTRHHSSTASTRRRDESEVQVAGHGFVFARLRDREVVPLEEAPADVRLANAQRRERRFVEETSLDV